MNWWLEESLVCLGSQADCLGKKCAGNLFVIPGKVAGLEKGVLGSSFVMKVLWVTFLRTYILRKLREVELS